MALSLTLFVCVSNGLCADRTEARRGGNYEASCAPYQTPRVEVKRVDGPRHDETLFSIMNGNGRRTEDHYIKIPFDIAKQIPLFQPKIGGGRFMLPNENEQSLKLLGEYIQIRSDINNGAPGAKEGMLQWNQRLSNNQDPKCTKDRFQGLANALYKEEYSLGLLTLPVLKLGNTVPLEGSRNKKLAYITSMGLLFTLPLEEAQSIWGSKIAKPRSMITDLNPTSTKTFLYVANYMKIRHEEKDLPKLEVFVAGIPETEAPAVKTKLAAIYQGQRLPGFHPTFYAYAQEELQSFLNACKGRRARQIQAILLMHKIAVFSGIAALLGSIYVACVQLTK